MNKRQKKSKNSYKIIKSNINSGTKNIFNPFKNPLKKQNNKFKEKNSKNLSSKNHYLKKVCKNLFSIGKSGNLCWNSIKMKFKKYNSFWIKLVKNRLLTIKGCMKCLRIGIMRKSRKSKKRNNKFCLE